MERKLIKQGGGGFTIYLPKKWVDENKLEKGDELAVSISGKDLIIGPTPSHKKTETEIKLTNKFENTIRSITTNAYRKGYDIIKIFFNNPEQYKILKKVVKTRLIGFDIIHKSKSNCILENVTEPSAEQFNNILNKMFLNIEDMFEITSKKLKGKFQGLEDFEEIEERIQKYDNFCKRIISKEKFIKQNSEIFWTFTTLIIHAQRELYMLNKILHKKVNSKKIIELLDTAYDIFKKLKKAFYEKNLDLISSIHGIERQTIYKKAYSLMKNKSETENIVIYHLTACIRKLHLSTSSLSGLIV